MTWVAGRGSGPAPLRDSAKRNPSQISNFSVARRSRPESGAKSLRKLEWRRALTSKMLFALKIRLVRLSAPNGLSEDRTRGVEGKGVAGRVDTGGGRHIKKKRRK